MSKSESAIGMEIFEQNQLAYRRLGAPALRLGSSMGVSIPYERCHLLETPSTTLRPL